MDIKLTREQQEMQQAIRDNAHRSVRNLLLTKAVAVAGTIVLVIVLDRVFNQEDTNK